VGLHDFDPVLSWFLPDRPLQDNVGYQLMKKMGWQSGCGLGKQQQGIKSEIELLCS
jgi:hypothetical protein